MFKVLLVLAAMLEIVYIVHPLTIVNNVIQDLIEIKEMELAINVIILFAQIVIQWILLFAQNV